MLIRQTLLYLPAQVISPLVQFASIIVWTHLLDPQTLGVTTMVIATQEICFALFFSWWSRYTLRFISSFHTPEDRRRYLRTELAATLFNTVLQTAVVVPGLLFFSKSAMDPLLIGVVAVFMISRSISNYLSERARANAAIGLYTLMQIAGPVIGFGVGLIGIRVFGAQPSVVLGGFVVAQFLGLAVALFICDFGRSWGRPDPAMIRMAIRFGGAVMLASLLAIVALNLPRFIVGHTLGVAAVGMFAAGYGLGLRASAFAVTLVSASAYPMVVRKMEREGEAAAFAQLSQNMTLVAATVAPVALGLLAVNASVVHILIAQRYRDATLAVLPLATIGGMLRYLRAHTTDQVFLIKVKAGVSTWVAVFDVIVAAISAYVGVRLMGVSGAAFGPMVSGLVTLVISFVLSRMMFGYRAPWRAFLRIFAAAGLMAAAITLVPKTYNLAVLIAIVCLGGAVYAGLLALFMPPERRLFVQMVAKRFGSRLPVVSTL